MSKFTSHSKLIVTRKDGQKLRLTFICEKERSEAYHALVSEGHDVSGYYDGHQYKITRSAKEALEEAKFWK